MPTEKDYFELDTYISHLFFYIFFTFFYVIHMIYFMAYEIFRICCGVPKSLFEVLVNHLEPFKCRFQTFELEEAATRVRAERSI